MNRGPEPRRGFNGDNLTMGEKAKAAYGAAPDWIAELAELVDRVGLKKAGAKIGYSGSALSQVINAKYPGDLAKVEAEVRAALQAPVVDCPVLDAISREDCLANQAKPFSAASAYSAHLYHACRRCPNARPTKGGHHG